MIDLVVVDDEELVRRGLVGWLATVPGVRVVGEAGSADECIKLLRGARPHVALVDVVLPGVSGIELMSRIKDVYPDTACLLLSGTSSPETIFEGFANGASGFLPKLTSPHEVRLAIESVASGHWYLSPLMTERIMRIALAARERARSAQDGIDGTALSERERELLKLLAEGCTFSEVAQKLDINPRSVERIKSRLEEKLGAQNIGDLVRAAIKLGLIHA